MGNLKKLAIAFSLIGIVALTACGKGEKGDTGTAGSCPDLGGSDIMAPSTSVTTNASGSVVLTCTDSAATVSGAVTTASGCGNTYYYIGAAGSVTAATLGTATGSATTSYVSVSSAISATAGDVLYYYSIDKACNRETTLGQVTVL